MSESPWSNSPRSPSSVKALLQHGLGLAIPFTGSNTGNSNASSSANQLSASPKSHTPTPPLPSPDRIGDGDPGVSPSTGPGTGASVGGTDQGPSSSSPDNAQRSLFRENDNSAKYSRGFHVVSRKPRTLSQHNREDSMSSQVSPSSVPMSPRVSVGSPLGEGLSPTSKSPPQPRKGSSESLPTVSSSIPDSTYIWVTQNNEDISKLDVSRLPHAEAIRERIFSKLHIYDDDFADWTFYRSGFDGPSEDEPPLDMAQLWGICMEAKQKSQKPVFLVKPSKAPNPSTSSSAVSSPPPLPPPLPPNVYPELRSPTSPADQKGSTSSPNQMKSPVHFKSPSQSSYSTLSENLVSGSYAVGEGEYYDSAEDDSPRLPLRSSRPQWQTRGRPSDPGPSARPRSDDSSALSPPTSAGRERFGSVTPTSHPPFMVPSGPPSSATTRQPSGSSSGRVHKRRTSESSSIDETGSQYSAGGGRGSIGYSNVDRSNTATGAGERGEWDERQDYDREHRRRRNPPYPPEVERTRSGGGQQMIESDWEWIDREKEREQWKQSHAGVRGGHNSRDGFSDQYVQDRPHHPSRYQSASSPGYAEYYHAHSGAPPIPPPPLPQPLQGQAYQQLRPRQDGRSPQPPSNPYGAGPSSARTPDGIPPPSSVRPPLPPSLRPGIAPAKSMEDLRGRAMASSNEPPFQGRPGYASSVQAYARTPPPPKQLAFRPPLPPPGYDARDPRYAMQQQQQQHQAPASRIPIPHPRGASDMTPGNPNQFPGQFRPGAGPPPPTEIRRYRDPRYRAPNSADSGHVPEPLWARDPQQQQAQARQPTVPFPQEDPRRYGPIQTAPGGGGPPPNSRSPNPYLQNPAWRGETSSLSQRRPSNGEVSPRPWTVHESGHFPAPGIQAWDRDQNNIRGPPPPERNVRGPGLSQIELANSSLPLVPGGTLQNAAQRRPDRSPTTPISQSSQPHMHMPTNRHMTNPDPSKDRIGAQDAYPSLSRRPDPPFDYPIGTYTSRSATSSEHSRRERESTAMHGRNESGASSQSSASGSSVPFSRSSKPDVYSLVSDDHPHPGPGSNRSSSSGDPLTPATEPGIHIQIPSIKPPGASVAIPPSQLAIDPHVDDDDDEDVKTWQVPPQPTPKAAVQPVQDSVLDPVRTATPDHVSADEEEEEGTGTARQAQEFANQIMSKYQLDGGGDGSGEDTLRIREDTLRVREDSSQTPSDLLSVAPTGTSTSGPGSDVGDGASGTSSDQAAEDLRVDDEEDDDEDEAATWITPMKPSKSSSSVAAKSSLSPSASSVSSSMQRKATGTSGRSRKPDLPPLIIDERSSDDTPLVRNASALSEKRGGGLKRGGTIKEREVQDLWAFRPDVDQVYDDLEKFFPEHDLDRPIIDPSAAPGGAVSPASSPANENGPVHTPQIRGRKYKKSIRKVAMDRKNLLQRLSTVTGDKGGNSGLMRRKSTKLWGTKVEEVTPSILNTSSVPESPSDPDTASFKWVKGELIGKGSFGHVYLGLNVTTGDMLAVKQVELPKTLGDRDDARQASVVAALKSEIEFMKDLDHPHIVQYLGFEETETNMSIFLEYVPGGSVGRCLRKHGRVDENTIKYFISQILDGLAYLHSQNIVHRDMKADNILVDLEGTCKISDFGISKRSNDIYNDNVEMSMQGTIFWMAPEVVHNQKRGYSAKADIWSLGCIMIELAAGRRPWSDEDVMQAMFKLGAERKAPPVPDDVVLSPVAKHFLEQCHKINPSDRPEAGYLLKYHRFLDPDPFWRFADSPLGMAIRTPKK